MTKSKWGERIKTRKKDTKKKRAGYEVSGVECFLKKKPVTLQQGDVVREVQVGEIMRFMSGDTDAILVKWLLHNEVNYQQEKERARIPVGHQLDTSIELEEIRAAAIHTDAAAGVGVETTKDVYKVQGDSIVT